MASVRQEIRFCTSRDGARGAYATFGKVLPLVKAAHWLSHLEFDVTSPVWRHWLSELGRQRTFVRSDQRGCGLSERDVEDFSFEAWVADLEAVVGAFARNVVPGAHAADRARSRRVRGVLGA